MIAASTGDAVGLHLCLSAQAGAVICTQVYCLDVRDGCLHACFVLLSYLFVIILSICFMCYVLTYLCIFILFCLLFLLY